MANKQKKLKRIGIDARFYGPLGKGLGRYTKEIVDRVTRMEGDIEYVIFLGPENFNEFECARERVTKVLSDVRWYGLAEQIRMPRLIRKYKLDLVHFPHFNVPLFCACPFVVTIHDLILTKFPTQRATTLSPLKYWLKNQGYKTVISSAVKKATKIITVSEFTKKDIIEQFGVEPARIAVTYEGAAAGFCQLEHDDKKVIFKYNITKPYLLYVGNAYPHKNLEILPKVMQNIKKSGHNLQLVLVGKEDYFYQRLKQTVRAMGLEQDVLFPGYVPDKDLGCFYRNAVAYIFPSLYEGFGLPPLEAMQHGCPVLSSDRASMPEVLGDAAGYFDPNDTESIETGIWKILDEPGYSKDLTKRGYMQATQYSWQQCARETKAIYDEALNNSAQ